MKTNLLKAVFICFAFLTVSNINAQINQEVGIFVGPVSFRGDYGEREDSETNFGNTGFGIGINHYLNFSYSGSNKSYFYQHFKVRNQFLYHSTNLKHYGRYVNSQSSNAYKLKAMTGKASVIELGTGLEWYYGKIRDFERSVGKIMPYAGLGVNVVFASPTNETSLPGRLGSSDNTWPSFLWKPGEDPRISSQSQTTFSLNFQAGVKYKVSRMGEINLEARWHNYFSDMVDGLNPSVGNDGNDWMIMLGIGYIHYL
ncbi:MAG: THC0290_0291 family protein [Psychroflexus halocasei]